MKDTKEFESLLEKSRKLQALIADGSGATEGDPLLTPEQWETFNRPALSEQGNS